MNKACIFSKMWAYAFMVTKPCPCFVNTAHKVDDESKIARIPRPLVEQALATTPNSLVLGARNPRYNYPLPSTMPHYCMDGTAAFAQDFETGERRYGTRKDIENGMCIFQELDLGVMAWPPVTASDTPAGSRAWVNSICRLCSCPCPSAALPDPPVCLPTSA